ncbi:MAG: ribonuclease P protein component [Bacteroidales bacterium]|nr:ribonuclease P protein component [Bacteroidales bacterium]
MAGYSFPKNEKLKSRKLITMLFEKGHTEYLFPLKTYWMTSSDEFPPGVKAGFSVPKKKFKRAVDRNLLKRRMREAYRLNKAEIITKALEKNITLSIFFIFTANKILNYHQIEETVIAKLEAISKKI